MEEIREIPCPQCGDQKTIDASDLCPGVIFPCWRCECHLVMTPALTLARATTADMEKRPLAEQKLARQMQRIWRGLPQDTYC